MALNDISKLEVTDAMLGDLTTVANSVDSLAKLVSATDGADRHVGIGAVAKAIAPKLEVSTAEAREMLFALFNIYQAQTQLDLSAQATVDLMLRSLEMAAEKDLVQLAKRWKAAAPKIVAALGQLHSDHPLVIASKAYRVATSRQYELVEMRIFTDLRPVFNEAGDSILQAVITHVLSIDYHDGTDHRVIQFNLDANDVKDLKEMCARAERKATVVKRDLRELPWPTTVFREPTEPRE
ncbi:MAG: hypothetical protein L0241_21065 [Planctomycetia bacterium]|nr:hypothetical protein [Planctomycetia bacterium]